MNQSKRRWVTLVAVGALLVTACAPASAPTATARPTVAAATAVPRGVPTQQAGAKPTPKGKIVAVSPQIRNDPMDPHVRMDGNVSTMAWLWSSPLVFQDREAQMIPWLATNWEASLDGKYWDFTVRKGVKFHNGDEVTVDDAVFSLTRYGQQKTNPTAASWYIPFFDRAESLGADKLRVYTKAPDPAFPRRLLLNAVVLPKKYMESVGDAGFEKAPVGSGPFKFVSKETGAFVNFQAFANYWAQGPYVAELSYRMIPESVTRIAMLKTGEADIVETVPPELIKDVESQFGLKTVVVRQGRVEEAVIIPYDAQKQDFPPFLNVKVRQALQYVLDRDEIARSFYKGYASAAAGYWMPYTFGTDPTLKPYPYDPAKAKQLLAEAGYPNGFETVIMTGSTATDVVELAQIMSDYFAKVGIKAKVDVKDAAYVGRAMQEKTLPAGIVVRRGFGGAAWAGDFGISSHRYSSKWAVWGYEKKRPDTDAMIEKQFSIMDAKEREALLKKINRTIYEDAFDLPLFFIDVIHAAGPRIKDWPLAKDPFLMNFELATLKD